LIHKTGSDEPVFYCEIFQYETMIACFYTQLYLSLKTNNYK